MILYVLLFSKDATTFLKLSPKPTMHGLMLNGLILTKNEHSFIISPGQCVTTLVKCSFIFESADGYHAVQLKLTIAKLMRL